MTSTGIYVKLTDPYVGIQTWGSSGNPQHTGIAAAQPCCPCVCFSFEDDFNTVPDTTNLGSAWYEHTGQWGIESLKCVEKYGDTEGTADAILMCTLPITDHVENGMHVAVSFIDSQVGDIYRIYVCCDEYDEPETGLLVEFENLDGTWWKTTITGGGTDGTVNQIPDPSGYPGGGVRGWVCADHLTGQVKAGMVTAGYEYAWADDLDPGPGRYCGFGHDNEEHQNVFDDFVFGELRTVSEVCSDCWCWCLREASKRHLMATIVNASQRAACLNGVTWNMDWEWNSGLERYVGTAEYPNYSYGYTSVDFVLQCFAGDDDDEDWPGRNWMLTWGPLMQCCVANTGGCDAGHIPVAELSRCSPFSLVFGPFTLVYDDLVCTACYAPGDMTYETGTYYIMITEAA